MKFIPTRGAELRRGDVIAPWFERTATIVSLEPYRGPLASIFPDGARLATLAPIELKGGSGAFMARGITIDNGETYNRVAPDYPEIDR